MKKLFKKPKKETFTDIVIYSYIFPEGIYVGYSFKNLDDIKFIFKNIIRSYPLSELLDKYDSIKPKIIKTVNLRKYGDDYDYDEIYKYMREAIDECGYKPARLLNKNLKLYGYDDDDIEKQEINLKIFFSDNDDDDDKPGRKRTKSF